MRFTRIKFIDENFGEEVECVLIWDNNSFILITLFEDEIKIAEYKDVEDFIKEFLSNKNELDFLREQIEEISDERSKGENKNENI